MRWCTAILMAMALVAAAGASALAVGPGVQGFPLEKGAVWTFEGPVECTSEGSDDVVEKVLTWNMEITDTIERQHVLAAVVKGHPLDLAFCQEGKTQPGDYLIVRVGEEQYYMLMDERVQDALKRLQDQDDVLTDLVQDTDLFLDLPLTPGKLFGETFQVTRQDGMYYWSVVSEGSADLDGVAGVEGDSGLTQYELSFDTLSGDLRATFVPGLGFTRYGYSHHGSPAAMDLKLVAYRPGGSAVPPAVTLTGADNGKAVELAQGDILAIVLKANPTTGYIWEAASGDANIIKLEGEPDYRAESSAIGAGGVMTLKFRAVGVGATDLKLVHHRPWEKDVEPIETFAVSVKVK